MRIAIIDNFDSFTWNLFHYLETLADEVKVIRYDAAEITELSLFDSIVISPGPGLPSDYPKLKELIAILGITHPILGICLGHQAIAEAFGARLKNLKNVLHGVERHTIINDKTELLFEGLPESILTGHYHSWVVEENSMPKCLKVTASDKEGTIMALTHTRYNIKGVQFHPESIMTTHGKNILKNWVDIYS